MRKYSRFLALLCSLALILTLAACYAKSDNKSGTPDNVMPVIHINTEDGKSDFVTKPTREDKLQDNIDYVSATVSVGGCDEEYVIDEAEAEVKVRGNYTLEYPKKPIRIKFDKKQRMLGLNEGEKFKNWVLLADWKDLSMCNNVTAFYLADAILGTDGYYCTDYMNVEVYINGEYWGVYLLAEQQEAKEGRVDVPEAKKTSSPTDIGYLFEYDAYFWEERNIPDGDPTFEIDYSLFAQRYSDGLHGYTAKSDIESDEQLEFLSSYVENAHKILCYAVYENRHYAFTEDCSRIVPVQSASVKDTVSSVIDLQSLVDMYLLNEIICNPDIAWSSFYISLDMSENGSRKLTFEAPWDYDSCFGIRAGFERNDIMYAANTCNPWLRPLSEEEWFMDMVKEKWQEIKDAGVPDSTLAMIKERSALYADYYEKNYERWSERIENGNHELIPLLNSCKTQNEAADYLINWLSERFEYLDSQWS